MTATNYRLRSARTDDGKAMAAMWHDAWHDAHDDLVDPVWRRARDRGNFLSRIGGIIPNATVAERDGLILGYSSIREDEMHQLFVASGARGTGLATDLIRDAEQRLQENGVDRAWLFCVKGNSRAFRFYERMGWHETSEDFQSLEVGGTEYRVTVFRMEKDLGRTGKEQ